MFNNDANLKSTCTARNGDVMLIDGRFFFSKNRMEYQAHVLGIEVPYLRKADVFNLRFNIDVTRIKMAHYSNQLR